MGIRTTPKKILSSLAFLLMIFSMFENCSPNSKENKPELADKDTHLGEMMGQMQYYFVKLGLALQHHNPRLANFYVHEWNEVYEEIVLKNISDEGINVSMLITQILEPQKKVLEEVVMKNDTLQFDVAYHAVIASCNNCHTATKHDFIVIEEPKEEFNGQNFGVQQ